jgi:hypothetical protein
MNGIMQFHKRNVVVSDKFTIEDLLADPDRFNKLLAFSEKTYEPHQYTPKTEGANAWWMEARAICMKFTYEHADMDSPAFVETLSEWHLPCPEGREDRNLRFAGAALRDDIRPLAQAMSDKWLVPADDEIEPA